ncbi:MFS transporter [Polaribacter aestuariivivens]|uniref:MFS transporter n=1 Tax=Polaribacter aestuariivivens TaxID=2304626 RepID=A0A5S3N7W7_9FLAO|nr:MFS transporter [Polaribacter aestuariivivens]TMM31420.1 MFS transporter [Polaribacter aestuariivivens]
MKLQIGDKKLINAWAFYDWANSVYSLVISTAVFPLFYSAITDGKVVTFLGMEWDYPDTLYSYALSFSFLVVAFMSPILSAIADYTGNKLKFMKFFCWLGGLSVISMFFFKDLHTAWIGIICTILASIGFWSSIVFYNSYLPEVAYPEQQDAASAKGFIHGYIGSIILLIFCLAMILAPNTFGFDLSISEAILTNGTEAEIATALEDAKNAASLKAMRISFVMVGLWWIGFAQITFKKLPNNVHNRKPEKDYIWKGFKELKKVWIELKNYPTLRNFLIAFFLLSVGVQTIILLATIFGSSELGLGTTNLIVTVLLIQFVAILGAYVFSNISKKFGNFKAIKITIFIWILVCFSAFMLEKELPNVEIYFYALGGLLGLVLGAIQSLTRSTYSKLLPKTHDNATYFSFYDVTEKIAIVLGTFVFGFLIYLTDSMQWSVLSLALFFVASLIVLSRLKRTEHVY